MGYQNNNNLIYIQAERDAKRDIERAMKERYR